MSGQRANYLNREAKKEETCLGVGTLLIGKIGKNAIGN